MADQQDRASGKLWGGRFAEATEASVERFTASVHYDARLYRHDIAGSRAHDRMLVRQELISAAEGEAIERGLAEILAEIEAGTFVFRPELEDIHMNIEKALTDKVGAVGEKLHTARSRNDQVAPDLRLYLREEARGSLDCWPGSRPGSPSLPERIAFLYLPVLVVVIMSFHPDIYLTFPLPGYSLRWYMELLHDELMIRATLNSLWLGGLTAFLSAVIGTPCALGLVRLDFPGKRLLNTFVLAPMIIPQIITGISLLILLHFIHIPRGYPYLIIGHVLLTLPYIVVTVSSQLYGFPRELEEAALSMGANEIQTFFEVTLPLIAPSIFAVDIPQGAWYEPDENGVDRGGCVNILTSHHWTPFAYGTTQHTIMVEVEKVGSK